MNKRAKGLEAEREVANIWKGAGLEVRNLEGQGDHLVIVPPVYTETGGRLLSATLHSEVKRQERFKLAEWLEQADKEAPAGTVAVVSFRKNHARWYSCLLTEDLAELVAR